MARSSEKAMTQLARWRNAKMAEEGMPQKTDRRPYLASECSNLKDCEKWRLQIIREISKKVSQIQNAGLGEFRIRDLNDEINKLLREKVHWERRIVELGGRDMRRKSRMLDNEGKEVAGSSGYKYFGAARELPGVRELFDAQPAPAPQRSRAELMKDIDSKYYGFLDDDDCRLIPLEIIAEQKAVAKAVEEWKAKKANGEKVVEEDEEEDIYLSLPEMSEQDRLEEAMQAGKEQRWTAHVPIPSQKDIEEALLRRKKQELLQMYALDDDVEDDKK
ncbi:hypothetical protein TCAL_01209 [Tigriopus californicus]|uniref:Pre-mRNA-splicing factor ISY1 homolog n=1 Tax=Tigriopus californicus TaxID=6832 RepID=A0A553NXP1_TIGCA|nr:pre-mRNA-splicing factor ISY1 homolog [Tigriopus californicus]TRY70199.1 hypothetical protein TCAL_01209 [Tigriopus californicus]|eukprot:TCALIF_01209-PA protein Name:"Similar to Isy1 Pre-mRNA-splicing factor ISY1 homolog (Mus musculus)" AED:0.09 eAED:0.09 QI:0/-1/0/1/-1/1/1/0/274